MGSVSDRANDVAIVGMSCVFPGADNLHQFWQNIVSKHDAIDNPSLFDKNTDDKVYCKRGGYLHDLARFDPMTYGIMPKAIDGAEPEHFLALRVADEALRDAGYPQIPINRERTGVIMGRGTFANRGLANLNQHGYVIDQTLELLQELNPSIDSELINTLKEKLIASLPPLDAQTAPGVVSSLTSGRIANRLNLSGVNYCVDGACASSLVAVEHGMRDLRDRRCDMVLAGGVQLSANILVLRLFSELGALSKNGNIRPFDTNSDGTLLGDGVGVLVLKRLEDAEKDGNRIYSILKAVGTSSDGKAKSIVAPRHEGQVLALERAYEESGIDPQTVGLIEAHGTSMPVGDEVELRTLQKVFGVRSRIAASCAVGSVKSMIGHLIPAAGVASLIKTSLALYHKTLPPSLNCEKPIDTLQNSKSIFYINTETRPWVHGYKDNNRRAGINAFGFGGVNAHAILEEHIQTQDTGSENFERKWDSELLVFDAPDRRGLVQKLHRVLEEIEKRPELELNELAYTLHKAYSQDTKRLTMVVKSKEELFKKISSSISKLEDPSSKQIKVRSGTYFFEHPLSLDGKIAFLFPGEGSQYVNMLSTLSRQFPCVRHCLDLADTAFLEEGLDYILSDILYPPPTGLQDDERRHLEDRIWEMEIAVQSTTTANRALFSLLSQFGIKPHAVLGHSSGEFAALEASGALPFSEEKDLIKYVLKGKQTVRAVSELGEKELPKVKLIAVGSDDTEIAARVVSKVGGSLQISMDNCPFQIIICGNERDIDQAIKELNTEGATCSTLPFNRPYHTSMFSSAMEPLKRFFNELDINAPEIPMYSCATAELFTQNPDEVRQLAIKQWVSCVRFRDTIKKMYDDGFRIFIEVGPGGNLTSFVNDTLKGQEYAASATNLSHKPELFQLQQALGLTIAQGLDLDLSYLYQARSLKEIDFDYIESNSKRPPKLNLALPKLALDSSELSSFQKDFSSRRPKIQNASPPQKQSVETTNRLTELGKDVISKEEPQNDSIPVELTPSEQAVHEHFKTMDIFLKSQEAVMLGIFSPSQGNSSPQAKVYTNSLRAKTSSNTKLPFTENIIEIEEGKRLLIQYEFKEEEDLFLADHALGGKVSHYDKALKALLVNPLTMSIEVIAQAAAALFPGKIVTSIKNIEANRWVTAEGGSLKVALTASLNADGLVRVAMTEIENLNKAVPPHIRANVELAEQYPSPRKAKTFSLSSPRASRFSQGNLYTMGMFSGPNFQGIEEIKAWGNDGVIGTLLGLTRKNMFASNADPTFVADPALMDAAGQLLAHWHAEHDNSKFNMFPYKLEELKIYGPTLPEGERVEGRLHIKPITSDRYRAQIDLVNANGEYHATIRGWEVKTFALPETFYGILHNSPQIVLSHERSDLLPKSYAERSSFRLVDWFTKSLLLEGGRIWLRVLAHQILSRKERDTWNQLLGNDERKIQWLLGRAAAKDAVRKLLERNHQLKLCPADVEILNDKHGKPFVDGVWLPQFDRQLQVSISHSGIFAAAIATDSPNSAVGVDVQVLKQLEHGFSQFVFTEEENNLFTKISDHQRNNWCLRGWCAKEAAGKASGFGLGGNPKNWFIKEFDIEKGKFSIECSEDFSNSFPSLSGLQFEINTFIEDNRVIACTFKNTKEFLTMKE
ncbi:MAG: beta-ketoacyl synthase N-terminal-like domain-containing protein [Verrucomicrobiota bacterium]